MKEFERTVSINGERYKIYSLQMLSELYPEVEKLPFSIRVLTENVLRNFDGKIVTQDHP